MGKLLLGHVSPETAYRVEGYPYGFRLKCSIRYWVETADSGAKKGQMRFMSQTTNPKVPGEHWNKPKGTTYADLVVMNLVPDEKSGKDHVLYAELSLHSSPVHFERVIKIIGTPPPAEIAPLLLRVLNFSRRMNPNEWKEHDLKKAETSGYVSDAELI